MGVSRVRCYLPGLTLAGPPSETSVEQCAWSVNRGLCEPHQVFYLALQAAHYAETLRNSPPPSPRPAVPLLFGLTLNVC